MAVSSFSCPRVFSGSSSSHSSSFECRSDPDFSGSARLETPKISARAVVMVSFSGVSSMIFRFPPNFVRQLSTKARRNCSNIGVAQIVAASWSNNAASGSSTSAAAASGSAAASAVPAPAAPVEMTTGDEMAVVDGLNNVQMKALADLKKEASFLSSDGSLTIHAGIRFFLYLFIIILCLFQNIFLRKTFFLITYFSRKCDGVLMDVHLGLFKIDYRLVLELYE